MPVDYRDAIFEDVASGAARLCGEGLPGKVGLVVTALDVSFDALAESGMEHRFS
jgi:hypothetical protein